MIEYRTISQSELTSVMARDEDHFSDFKAKDVAPAKLQETFVAFANADGGDIYVGIHDKKHTGDRLDPFATKEDANAIIHVLLEQTSPTVEGVAVELLQVRGRGFLLHLSIPKSPKVHYTAGGDCYVRSNAGKVKIKGERVTALAYSKGAVAYERVAVRTLDIEELIESPLLADYMTRVKSSLDQKRFLRKQRLLAEADGKDCPNVCGALLFDEEPQATLDTRCAIKVYRLRTTEAEYRREQLGGTPTTINGPVEAATIKAIAEVSRLLDGATYYEDGKLAPLRYPVDAIHEVVVNAVLHRDYSLNDDIHVRVYDNRIEVQSPGKLPGYMTLENLYDERFSRNPNLVRMLHNLPKPLNHDIGEGLDTARTELRKAGLVAPSFEHRGNSFVVTLNHQRLASIEDVVLKYFSDHPDETVTNKQIRELSGEDDINKVKKALQQLRADGRIEPVDPDALAFNFRYRVVK
ncbi:MAG TPA: ATP-binding protein [Rhodocyclaceae bacterium]|nr:ATP-binding protein [Rhodocyclaceae bacterium]